MTRGSISRTGARKLLKRVTTPAERKNAIVREKVIESLRRPLPPEMKRKKKRK